MPILPYFSLNIKLKRAVFGQSETGIAQIAQSLEKKKNNIGCFSAVDFLGKSQGIDWLDSGLSML